MINGRFFIFCSSVLYREGKPDVPALEFSVRIAGKLLGGDIDCGKSQKHFDDDVFHGLSSFGICFVFREPDVLFRLPVFFSLITTLHCGIFRKIAYRLQNGNLAKKKVFSFVEKNGLL